MDDTYGKKNNEVTKRRRKLVKSCLFCRKRKLKCNKAKPMCQQCSARKLPSCVYLSNFNFDVISVDEIFDKNPNVRLLNEIIDLKSQLDHCMDSHNNNLSDKKNKSENNNTSMKNDESTNNINNNNNASIYNSCTSSNTINSRTINPLTTFKTFLWRDNYLQIFGPTSWRTILTADGTKFQLEFTNLWNKLKPKCTSESFQCRDLFLSPLKTDVIHKIDGTVTDTSLTQLVCNDLPSFTDIKKCLNSFFNGPLHELLQILDPKKTWKDLYECFIVDQNSDRVINMYPPDGINFCKIGIILSIIVLCTYDNNSYIPESMIRYFIQVNSMRYLEVNFTENAQFLLMCCFFKIHHGEYSRWDGTQILQKISETCQCCISLGFDNVGKWYRNKESVVGDLKYLENTMLCTLFVDVFTSFDVGKPTFISNQMLSMHLFEQNLKSHRGGFFAMSRNRLFVDFIKLARKCVNDLNSVSNDNKDHNKEDIDTYILELQTFLTTYFPNLSNYTAWGIIFSVDPFEIIILSNTLSMLFNFHNIKRAFYKDISISTKNGMVKYGLLTASLCINTLLSMFEADKVAYPEVIDAGTRLSPYLNLSLSLINSAFIRVVSEFYSVFMARLTLQEKGYVILDTKCNHDGSAMVSLEDTYISTDRYYCFTCVMHQFRNILDQMFIPKWDQLHQLMKTSHSLHSLLVLERMARQLLDQGLVSRKQAETHWQQQGLDLNEITSELLTTFTNEVWDGYAAHSKSIWSMTPEELLHFDVDQSL